MWCNQLPTIYTIHLVWTSIYIGYYLTTSSNDFELMCIHLHSSTINSIIIHHDNAYHLIFALHLSNSITQSITNFSSIIFFSTRRKNRFILDILYVRKMVNKFSKLSEINKAKLIGSLSKNFFPRM